MDEKADRRLADIPIAPKHWIPVSQNCVTHILHWNTQVSTSHIRNVPFAADDSTLELTRFTFNHREEDSRQMEKLSVSSTIGIHIRSR